MKAFPSQFKLPDLRNNVKNLRPGHRVAQWHIRLICRPNPGKQYLFNCLCLQVKTLVLLPLDGFYFTLSSIPNVESIKLGRKQKKRLKHLKIQASKITTGFVAILQKCVFFFSPPVFQVHLHNSNSINHAYKESLEEIFLFPLQKGLTAWLYTILPQATMHARRMNPISSLHFLSSQLFFHCVINSAKWKHC